MRSLFWRNKLGFEKAEYKDSFADRRNPGRGWYRIFSMDASAPCPTEEWKWERCKDEQLALLMIDIGRYASVPLSCEALTNIKAAFAFFRQQDKELILRFVYDRTGKGMESEPSSASRITEHMAQLSSILEEYKDIIFCIQGLFIGSWGEMHSSKFLSPDTLRVIWKSLRDSAPQTCYFAVRKPEQHRILSGDAYDSLTPEKARDLRIGLFNDGLLGSETDLGTFDNSELNEALDFQDKLCRYVPNGGEAVGNSPCGDIQNAVERFKKIHISYLNSVYDEAVLSRWKNQSFGGMNGYDYIGAHLGYRFLVTGARLIKQNVARLAVTIKNTGFANIYDECEVILSLVGGDNSVCEVGQTYDLRNLCSDCDAEMLFLLPKSVTNGSSVSYEARLHINRKKDGRRIALANEGAGDWFVLGIVNI